MEDKRPHCCRNYTEHLSGKRSTVDQKVWFAEQSGERRWQKCLKRRSLNQLSPLRPFSPIFPRPISSLPYRSNRGSGRGKHQNAPGRSVAALTVAYQHSSTRLHRKRMPTMTRGVARCGNCDCRLLCRRLVSVLACRCPIMGSPFRKVSLGRQFTDKNPPRPVGDRAGRIFVGK